MTLIDKKFSKVVIKAAARRCRSVGFGVSRFDATPRGTAYNVYLSHTATVAKSVKVSGRVKPSALVNGLGSCSFTL